MGYSTPETHLVNMRVLIFVAVLVTCGLSLPAKHKPNKFFPKKFISGKDSYGAYNAALVEDLQVPDVPSSYDAYYVQPQDPILPPAGSTYIGVYGTPEDEMVAPPEDSFSNPEGTPLVGFLPPPVHAIVPEGAESYVSYTGEGSEGLVAPPVFSYASTDDSELMGDALSHMVAMARLLPVSSSYMDYNPSPLEVMENIGGPATLLLPPTAVDQVQPQSSSYSQNSDDVPSVDMVPPPAP